MTHGSLFSGIGGFDLAAEWMGWNNLFHCEWNPFGQKVLHHYWPDAEQFTDITKTDFTKYANKIDILTGGFPCQPYSAAGKRLGKDDERHLWPEMLRAVREIKPRWVVGENVFGLINWNGGMVFEEVQADLEAEGYEVQPYILPAAAVNAPHRRDRVWFVAYCNRPRLQKARSEQQTTGFEQYGKLDGASKNTLFSGCLYGGDEQERAEVWQQRNFSARNINGICRKEVAGSTTDTLHDGLHDQPATKDNGVGKDNKQSREQRVCTAERPCDKWDAMHTDSKRLEGRQNPNKQEKHNQKRTGYGAWIRTTSKNIERKYRSNFHNFPTQSPIHRRDDGLSRKLAIFVVKEVRDEISKTSQENRIQDLSKVWKKIQQEEVWEKIRGLYSLESKEVLFNAMQLYSTGHQNKVDLSPFSEEVSKEPLRILRKYGEFRSSPQGQKLEKQRNEQFRDALSFLPHEVALAARAYTNSIRKFEAWHRNESIKAYGNAIVPQVVYEIFKTIQKYEQLNK